MSSTEPTGAWADAMRRAEIGDPRNGRPSWTQLAEKAGVSVSTVTNAVFHRTKASPATIQALALALRVRPGLVSEWIGQGSSPVGEPYVPVDEAALLSQHERDALDDLIRAIARGRREDGEHGGNAAPTKEAGDSAGDTEISNADQLATEMRRNNPNVSDADIATVAAVILGPDAQVAQGEQRQAPHVERHLHAGDAFLGLAASAGEPAHVPDGTTGEENQDSGNSEPA